MAPVLDRHAFRRLVAGATLVLAPLFGLAWSLLVPPYTDGMRGEVSFIAAHPHRWTAGTYAGVVFSYLMIPAVLGLLGLVGRRGVVLAYLGGILAIAGAAFHGSLLGFQLAETSLVQHVADPAQRIALATALFEGPAFTAVLVPVMGMFLGLVLLALVLWRTGAIPGPVALAILAAVAVELLGPPAFKARLFFALLAAALGWAGVIVLRSGRVSS